MLDVRGLTHRYPGGVTALDGVSLSAPPGMFKSANVLAFEKRAIASGDQTITLRGLKIPAGATLHVGIDPYNKRIDRNSSDNVVKATWSGAKGS